MFGDEFNSGVLSAIIPTSCSGVRPDRTAFSKSASVSTKKIGGILVKKKLSNHTDSSRLNDCRKDLSKRVMGPTCLDLLLANK